ncbi:Clp protease N-terminal domain-containing protein [Nocardia sp. NPDC056611]|uniref:Clp protease N-terminal domain-containing protein n=1 Tax=Nocardia sp. NPDC056611 TaxID=3345877 RepID=UPI00366C206B
MTRPPRQPGDQNQPTEQILVPGSTLQETLKAATAIAHTAGQSTVGVEHVVLALISNPKLWPRDALTAAGYPPESVADVLVTEVILRAQD